MIYEPREIQMHNGRIAVLRSASVSDASALICSIFSLGTYQRYKHRCSVAIALY